MNDIAIVERLDILIRQNQRIIQLLEEEDELDEEEPQEEDLLGDEDDLEEPEEPEEDTEPEEQKPKRTLRNIPDKRPRTVN